MKTLLYAVFGVAVMIWLFVATAGAAEREAAPVVSPLAAEFFPVPGTDCLTQLTLTWGANMPRDTWEQVAATVVGEGEGDGPFVAVFKVTPKAKERESSVCIKDVAWQGLTPLKLNIQLGSSMDPDYRFVQEELDVLVDPASGVVQWHFTTFQGYIETQYLGQVVTAPILVDLYLTVRMGERKPPAPAK